MNVIDLSNPCSNDTEAPTFAGCPSTIARDITDNTTTCLLINWTEPTATDNCTTISTDSIKSNYRPGFCFPAGLTTVTYSVADASGNIGTCSFAVLLNRALSCSVTGNRINNSCANNIPVISGSALISHDYMWLSSTTGTPTQISQAILRATTQNYTLPARVAVTTYFVRFARPRGCGVWSTANTSNVIILTPADCAPPVVINCTPSAPNTIAKSCANNLPVLTGSVLATHEFVWYASTTNTIPTIADDLVTGETGADLTLASRPTVATYYVRYARPSGCPTWAAINASNIINVEANECAPPPNCPPTSANTITKSCVNNLPVLTGSISSGHDFVWYMSTTNQTPTTADVLVAGVNTPSYTLPSRPTVTTYYVCYARPFGCPIWGAVNLSNVIVVNADECAPPVPNTIIKTCENNLPVLTGSAVLNAEYKWYKIVSMCNGGTSTTEIVGATSKDYRPMGCLSQSATFIRRARQIGSTTAWGVEHESNKVAVNAYECAPNCTVTNNNITKSCANNLPVITGAAVANAEYVWLVSTSSCPTQMNQIVAGAVGQNFTFTNSVTVTTYLVRCARPRGCTTWGSINRSNCLTISPTDCRPVCTPNFGSTKSYRIVSKKSGKAFDVSNGSTASGAPIIQWSYNGTSNQQWRMVAAWGGSFKIVARNSGKYLTNQQTCNGSSVVQSDCYSSGDKEWKIECVGNTGFYRIINKNSGKVLGVSGASTANGAAIKTCTWTGAEEQIFAIEEVPGAASAVTSAYFSMNAVAESDRVRLSWLTNTGFDNDFYTVEKMNVSTGEFEKMETINNTVYDDEVQTFNIMDINPTEGDNFYRVKLTYNNGKEKYTEIKVINFKRMVGFGAFPNPAREELNINLAEYVNKAVDIAIYNTFGKVITTKHIDNVSNAVEKFDVNDFSTGQYLIRVTSIGKRAATQQVMVQK